MTTNNHLLLRSCGHKSARSPGQYH